MQPKLGTNAITHHTRHARAPEIKTPQQLRRRDSRGNSDSTVERHLNNEVHSSDEATRQGKGFEIVVVQSRTPSNKIRCGRREGRNTT